MIPSRMRTRMKTANDVAKHTLIKPAPGKLAVQILPENQMTPTGLWLPEGPQHDGNMGEVIAVCDPYLDGDVETMPDYKIGDIVVFGKYQGTQLKIGRNTDVVILREQDILCELQEPHNESDSSEGAA